jgi:magnesium transporter
MEQYTSSYTPQRAVETVSRLVKRGATASYLAFLKQLRAADVAHVLANLKARDRDTVFRQLFLDNLTLAAVAVSEMSANDDLLEILDALEAEEISGLLQELPADDAAHLLSSLSEDRREQVLTTMQMERSMVAQELLQYPENTAGRIMTPDVYSLREHLTVAEAITALQRSSDRLEMVFYLYVVDDRNHLVGVVALRQLLLYPPATTLKKLMMTDVIKVHAEDDQEEVAHIVAKFNVVAVPVVDDDNKLIGMVTVDDVIDVMREEATEDLFALAGVDADDRALALPSVSFRRRLPSLAMSLGTAVIAGFTVFLFSGMFRSSLPLAVMLPIITVMGADAVMQTLTVIVRSLSSFDDMTGAAVRKVFLKELLVGAGNGVLFGAALAAVTLGWLHSPALAITVGVAMFCTLLTATVSGALVPLILRRITDEPAAISSVVAVTLTIVAGTLCYLGLAWKLLGG